jgi:tetratricopeptide (TPR) repeat protein
MEPIKVLNKHKMISSLVLRKRVKQAIDNIREFAGQSSKSDHPNRLNMLSSTYRNMIRYTAEGVHDPERKKVYFHLQQSLLELADEVKQDLLSRFSGWQTYWLRNNVEKENQLAGNKIIETIDDLAFKSELDEWLKETGTSLSESDSELLLRHTNLIENIFNHLWLTDKYGEAEDELVNIIRDGKNFTWYEQSIFVSALTLSTLRIWETKKVSHLISIYKEGVTQVKERAMAGLILVLQYYDERVSIYPEIMSQLMELAEDNSFTEHMRISVMQFIRSRETERIGKKLHDEILPKVAHLRPKLEDKLDLENLLPEDLMEGKNPDWEDLFEESEDVYKTMEEFSKLQMEGADVYMSAFANLKNFDFFRKFSNWFLPFYPDHDSLNEVFKDEVLSEGTNDLAEALYKTPFICNSDKFSLVLNLKHLPASQKSMMLKVFRMELEGMDQLKDGEIDLDPNLTFRTATTQYMQDFYRFYKLSPYRNEFEDIFKGRLDIYNSYFFNLIFKEKNDLTILADYYFGKDFYKDAVDLYERAINMGESESQLFEKAGYCYQQEGDYESAINMYMRSDILEKKTWTTKKIAYCLRRLGKNEDALKFYLEAETDDPDNMHTIAMIGHCYLDLNKFESALKYYFKVEYNDPDNVRVLRPIAWSYFVMGEFENSKKFYDRLENTKLTGHDYINIGHLYLCMGERDQALEYYRKSLSEGKIEKTDFAELIEGDKEYLINNKVDPDDLPIIIDHILFMLDY